ncbi:MAG: 4Fe-4S dicluster domain-containing protein [Lentisphaerae bacterium]|nr:4Fe-4S dicluster domain-containing protein [Lentisphaerota bacterium]
MNGLRQRIRASLGDANLQAALDNNATRRKAGRLAAFAQVPDHAARRARAHAVKADVIARLDEHLARFTDRVTANGIMVHHARDGAAAVNLVLAIVGDAVRARPPADGAAPLVAKAKSMVSEEIALNHALADHGIRAVETDLGEYIVQLRGERPSHIITPAVHLRRQDVGRLFADRLGIPYTEDIPTLTATARRVLREVFLTADVGVSGVNFGVVETGTLALVTNEGNGRMCTTVPPVHVALMGVERLVPTLDDLALFLSLLPRSATGQKLSVYTSLLHGPRRADDADGPRERHLILVDNGRRALRDSPLAEALACIRCGACLNICPVFRETGGHAYLGRDGSIAPYPGPIGSVVSAGLFGCRTYGPLAQASSLCGACREACPVDIDLPGLLLRVRAGETPRPPGTRRAEGVGLPSAVRAGLRAFRVAARHPRLFAAGQRLAALASRLVPHRDGWMRLPAATGWGLSKDFPRPAAKAFRARWGEEAEEESREAGVGERRAGTGDGQPAPADDDVAGAEAGDLIGRFESELAALGGIVHIVPPGGVHATVDALLAERGITHIQMGGDVPHVDVAALGAAGIEAQRGPVETIRAGLTGAIAGIAETGSIVLAGGYGRPLTASLVPPMHIAVLDASQLVATVAEALALPAVRACAAGAIVTGPSRTADIEMTLTIGVHGPGEIHVILAADRPDRPDRG